MALARDRIGRSYPTYVYEVSREKIREYATALGETDPRYLSDGDDCVAPPTFAASFTVVRAMTPLLADDGFGMHTSLVHGSQTFAFGDRPLRPGDRLACTPTVTDISSRGENEFLTVEVDCRFADGDTPAVTATSMFVLLGSADDGAGA